MKDDIEKFLRMQNAEHTRKQYGLVLNKFNDWCKGIWPEDPNWTRAFKDYMLSLGRKNVTVNYHMTVIANFYKYLTGNVMQYQRLKESPAQITFLMPDEVDKVLASANPEFKAVLMFMLDTGVRVSELVSISGMTFPEVPKEILVKGKGDKQRMLILSNATIAYLKLFFRLGLVFGQKWTVERIQRNLKQLGKAVGIEKALHPHMIRHTFATHMLWKGADISEVKEMLGHESLVTTQIYTHITRDRLRKSWDKYHETKLEG